VSWPLLKEEWKGNNRTTGPKRPVKRKGSKEKKGGDGLKRSEQINYFSRGKSKKE